MGMFDVIVMVVSISAVIAMVEQAGQVEVRAVLINCEPEDGENNSYDDENARFERDELFKHSVLKDCQKKLAITVKSVSDPNNSGDEYIPIEHVFRGSKRVRLLNPYVLRLQREPPLQAYRLRKIDTVSGTINKEETDTVRVKRGIKMSDEVPIENQQHNLRLFNISSNSYGTLASNGCFNDKNGLPAIRLDKNVWLNNRMKREENYLIREEFPIRADVNKGLHALDEPPNAIEGQEDNDIFESKISFNDLSEPSDTTQTNDWKTIENEDLQKSKTITTYNNNPIMDSNDLNEPHSNEIYPNKIITIQKNLKQQGKEYDMYEIGNADLWYSIQVQLFEKLTTPNGKTEWNDLSKGNLARVNSLNPEWSSPDMSVKYRSSEWIPRGKFTLPMTTLCLLAPGKNAISHADEYIVVPREDVEISTENNEKDINKNNDMFSSLGELTKSKEQAIRRVNIRTSRALFGSTEDKMSITNRDGDPYLTLLHRLPYHAQIDLEARADGNQLVYVGSSGRLMTLVADSSRQTRTVITVQATNTGLAAARFRVVARDCNPELPDINNEKVNEEMDGYILLPPKHTRSILLDLPFEIPVDSTHCSVALINGDGHSVAVRDVRIRKGDRCFCVWHCECVCLGEDPKLLCREMADARQIAAGLALRERTRSVRSVCYHDVMSINICVSSLGVLSTLLLCGLIKASLGLVFRCIGSWGMGYIVRMPRRLDHYYEPHLQNHNVVYDDEGWPIHPETKTRNVRVISWPMEFVLNIIFFVTVPSIIIYEAIKQMRCRCNKAEGVETHTNSKENSGGRNKDIQGTKVRGRRRRPLQRWMTPDAEDLSLRIWQKGIAVHSSVTSDLRPLLREPFCHSGHDPVCVHESCGDSELDDTEYVLMQMQKSRESLAKSQRKINSSTATITEKQ